MIDTFMILSLVWLYHIEYSQGPSLSLQVSTFHFLALMIALRCLSFKPGLVLFATFLACGGWILMLGYTLQHPVTEVTKSFVEYSMTNKVLIGIEIEKILALLATGLTMTVAVYGAALLLGESVNTRSQTDVMSRFFSAQTAQLIKSGKVEIRPGHGHKSIATILFIDLRDFTKLSNSMDPDGVMRLLSEYHDKVLPHIFKYNGSVDKFMGDGILVHFGAIVESPTHAADCVRAIDDIIIEIKRWNSDRRDSGQSRIEINMAAASGLVIFGATGSYERLEMTTIGSTVNTAAKLEKMNKKFDSIVTLDTKIFDLSLRQGFVSAFQYTTAVGQKIDGLEEPVDLFYLSRKSESLLDVAG